MFLIFLFQYTLWCDEPESEEEEEHQVSEENL